MTLIDLIRTYLYGPFDGPGMDTWEETLIAFLAAYDALAPDWSAAPEWAQWYAIDCDGVAHWYKSEPYRDGDSVWSVGRDGNRFWFLADVEVDLPLGIDWRLCLWKRPDA